jgi:hypothetical protein
MEPTVIYEMSCQCGAVFSGLEALRRHRERRWFVYGLMEPEGRPEPGLIRYVGKTEQTPDVRFKGHLKQSMVQSTHLGSWLRKLRAEGLKPVMIVLETGKGDGVQDAERWYIGWWGSTQLVNHHAGGNGGRLLDGPAGELTRERIRQSSKARLADAKSRKEHGRRMHESPAVQEHLNRLNSNPDVREMNAERFRKLNADPAFHARNAERRREHVRKLQADPEVQARRIESIRAFHASRRAKQQAQRLANQSQPQGAITK